MEDTWFESLYGRQEFKKAVSELHGKLLKAGDIPDLLRNPEHHCTVHRGDPSYYAWDGPIDGFCTQFGIDANHDLAYGPRHRIERHVLFGDPIGNLYHPLIRCKTEKSPIPHISSVCVLPPQSLLSNDDLNWLFLDLELLIVERRPAYPISPSGSENLFDSLKGTEELQQYRQRIQEAVDKRIITNPSADPHTLIALIEILRDEQELAFKQIHYILDMSEDAVRKRYKRSTFIPTATGIRIGPTPRRRRL